MRNPAFKEVKPNYRKGVLKIILQEGRTTRTYNLAFAVFEDKKIDNKNRFPSIAIDDRELDDQAASFVLEDGTWGDFPAEPETTPVSLGLSGAGLAKAKAREKKLGKTLSDPVKRRHSPSPVLIKKALSTS